MVKNIDGIVKNIKTGAISAASVISKKASNVYDISKSKIAAESVRREIERKFIQLGKLNYKNATEETDVSKETNTIIGEISILKDSLLEIEKNIASIKDQKICPKCNSSVAKNSIFCNICGTKFEEEPEHEQVAEKPSEDEEIIEVEMDIEVESDENKTEAEESEDDGDDDEDPDPDENFLNLVR